jgi:hypothetical protein
MCGWVGSTRNGRGRVRWSYRRSRSKSAVRAHGNGRCEHLPYKATRVRAVRRTGFLGVTARQRGPEQRTMVLGSPGNCRSFAKSPMAGRAGGTNRSGQRVSDANG